MVVVTCTVLTLKAAEYKNLQPPMYTDRSFLSKNCVLQA